MITRILALTALLLPLPLSADIYKTVDQNGNVVFTDDPKGSKAEKIELPTVNTQPPQATETARQPRAIDEPSRNYRLAVTSPAGNTQIPPGQRSLNLQVSTSPGLSEAHRLQATLNGVGHGPAGQSGSLTVNNLYRGTHQLGAQVLDADGNVLSRTSGVTIHVQRISLNSPARKAKAGN